MGIGFNLGQATLSNRSPLGVFVSSTARVPDDGGEATCKAFRAERKHHSPDFSAAIGARVADDGDGTNAESEHLKAGLRIDSPRCHAGYAAAPPMVGTARSRATLLADGNGVYADSCAYVTALEFRVAVCCGLAAALTTLRSASSAGWAGSRNAPTALCVVGFGIGTKGWASARGAFLLFTANMVRHPVVGDARVLAVRIQPRRHASA